MPFKDNTKLSERLVSCEDDDDDDEGEAADMEGTFNISEGGHIASY